MPYTYVMVGKNECRNACIIILWEIPVIDLCFHVIFFSFENNKIFIKLWFRRLWPGSLGNGKFGPFFSKCIHSLIEVTGMLLQRYFLEVLVILSLRAFLLMHMDTPMSVTALNITKQYHWVLHIGYLWTEMLAVIVCESAKTQVLSASVKQLT